MNIANNSLGWSFGAIGRVSFLTELGRIIPRIYAIDLKYCFWSEEGHRIKVKWEISWQKSRQGKRIVEIHTETAF